MEQISGAAKERLLHLLRILEHRAGEPVTSAGIEALTGWPSNTIRKDISCLGGDGEAVGSSSGYAPELLLPAIKKALGLEKRRKFCVVGLGRLGSAYLNIGAPDLGEFELVAGFDTNVNRTEILKSPVPLYPAYKMGEVIGRFGIEMALLCVPPEAAQAAAEKLAASGIRGIVNFAPAALKLPPEIPVRNVYVTDELRSLAIRMI
ncbi:MAG: CoA-binding protein [Treponema sp.]|jgi:redox-sensing transcriptional repressor|nr:CoA-binding protein [Treponema sp.]